VDVAAGAVGAASAPVAGASPHGHVVPFDDVRELYDTRTDWSQAHDRSKEMPAKLQELQRLWLIEAVKYNVLPGRGTCRT